MSKNLANTWKIKPVRILSLSLVIIVTISVSFLFFKSETSELMRDATDGESGSQYLLGYYYQHGIKFPQNYVEAEQWYLKAAEQGQVQAQMHLSDMYKDGVGIKKDPEKAFFWLKKASDQKLASAQTNLGNMYADGFGVPKDFQEAVSLWTLAADQGEANAITNLGFYYLQNQNTPENLSKAVAFLKRASDLGSSRAQFLLSGVYSGLYGEAYRNDSLALSLLNEAAIKGNSDAQHDLGLIYYEGKKVPKDFEVAGKWYRASMLGGNEASRKFIEKSNNYCAHTLEISSAALGPCFIGAYADKPNSQDIIAYMYATGNVLPKDQKKSADWFLRSAKNGDQVAQITLVGYYLTGDGVPKDNAEALAWYLVVRDTQQEVRKKDKEIMGMVSKLWDMSSESQKQTAIKKSKEYLSIIEEEKTRNKNHEL